MPVPLEENLGVLIHTTTYYKMGYGLDKEKKELSCKLESHSYTHTT